MNVIVERRGKCDMEVAPGLESGFHDFESAKPAPIEAAIPGQQAIGAVTRMGGNQEIRNQPLARAAANAIPQL